MSEFKRPDHVSDDPELCYRSGYQHGAYAILQAVSGKLMSAERDRLLKWVEINLQQWRYDRAASPKTPEPPTL
jgi:hypothetical protein